MVPSFETVEAAAIPFVSLLYVFAGKHRRSDVGDLLKREESAGKISLHVLELDLLRSEEHDVTDETFWSSIIARVEAAEFQVVICTPPCNTHSRARNSNRAGPPPLRSKRWPLGFPWLEGSHKREVEQANSFVDKTFQICRSAHKAAAAFLLEHPEDLGAVTDGSAPASIFGLQEMFELATDTRARTAAFHQCPWLALTSKPTRVVSTLDLVCHNNKLWFTWPAFDTADVYLGPLPKQCGHRHRALIGRSSEVAGFRTAPAAAYPELMCKWLVEMIIRFCSKPKGGEMPSAKLQGTDTDFSNRLGGENLKTNDKKIIEEVTSDEEEPGLLRPRLDDFSPGRGPPLRATWAGKSRELHDGAGLCSPGRWHPKDRKPCEWQPLLMLRIGLMAIIRKHMGDPARLCIRLACGQFDSSPFSEEALREGRALLAETVAKESSFSIEQLLEVQENQPFLLRLLGELLRLVGDPDFRIYFSSLAGNFWDGVPVGPGAKMPRTPAVFERKVRFRQYDDSEFVADVANYQSAAGPKMSEILTKQFREEEAMGLMYLTTLDEAKRDFSDLRIAAQGAIEKSDDSWRILHDATHGVRVNLETKLKDQIRMPSAGDQRTIMKESHKFDPGPHFSLQFDVKMAHRRYLHRRKDWGLLACRSNDKAAEVWINRCGTFGFVCASYWWARLAGGIARLAIRFAFHQWVFQLLFADDNRIQACGKSKFDNLVLILFVWILVGTPLSWRKCRGGLSCEWVGYWVDYSRFELGISENRANWLITWGKRVIKNGLVHMRDFAEGLGRLSFSAGVLEYCRPFLAPLYSWVAATPRGAILTIPPVVRLTLSWIIGQLQEDRRQYPCKYAVEDLGVLFKTDSKGESDHVVLGGFECRGGKPTLESRWFSVRLTAQDCPFLFAKGHGSRTIAASELMATLIAVHLFVEVPTENTAAANRGMTHCQGVTDNQGNSFVISRFMTTKFPLSAVLMQLATMLSHRQLLLELTWVPRTENTEADALTNGEFEGFDPRLRLEVSLDLHPFTILKELVELGSAFEAELALHKEARKRAPLPDGAARRKKRRTKTLWG